MGRLMTWADLVGRLGHSRTIVGLDRKRVGLGIIGLRKAGQSGHGQAGRSKAMRR